MGDIIFLLVGMVIAAVFVVAFGAYHSYFADNSVVKKEHQISKVYKLPDWFYKKSKYNRVS